jgi:DNA invertase Pin-like site-specific DNA recombinase
VNPNHLFLGTDVDNVKDKVRKGRQSRLDGKLNGMCKLSETQVREIVSLHEQGLSYRNLAKKFGIGNTQIARIIKKQSWRWLWG